MSEIKVLKLVIDNSKLDLTCLYSMEILLKMSTIWQYLSLLMLVTLSCDLNVASLLVNIKSC